MGSKGSQTSQTILINDVCEYTYTFINGEWIETRTMRGYNPEFSLSEIDDAKNLIEELKNGNDKKQSPEE